MPHTHTHVVQQLTVLCLFHYFTSFSQLFSVAHLFLVTLFLTFFNHLDLGRGSSSLSSSRFLVAYFFLAQSPYMTLPLCFLYFYSFDNTIIIFFYFPLFFHSFFFCTPLHLIPFSFPLFLCFLDFSSLIMLRTLHYKTRILCLSMNDCDT